MDQYTKIEIMEAIRQSVGAVKREYEEQWLTGEELCKQFQFITPSWLRVYGSMLPRVRATVIDVDGVEHRTGWTYPRYRIAEMARDNKLEFVMGREEAAMVAQHRRRRNPDKAAIGRRNLRISGASE